MRHAERHLPRLVLPREPGDLTGHLLGFIRQRIQRPDHLIRRLWHAHQLPAHSGADLPKCYSLMRSRQQP
jgi:hypothetical protein